MSLKAFHVLFIIATFALCIGTGAWLIERYRESGGAVELVVGAACLLGAAGVVVYFFWFLRKLRGVSYI